MANAEKGSKFIDAAIQRKPRLQSPEEFADEVLELHRKGMPTGEKTGWHSLDKYYTVMPGQLTIVSGWPGSGKSEWVDALMVNLSKKGWKFAVFSFENQPVSFHIAKMLEKLAVKPFGAGINDRIHEDELNELRDELSRSFAFTASTRGAFRLKDVLEAAEVHLNKYPDNPRGVVIDPWNELDALRPAGLSETEYISQSLSMVKSWAIEKQTHVFIVAHPQKIRREEGKLPVPRPDMISGSQNWWNKADCAVTVWRDNEEPDSRSVEIHVQKIRFKHVGRVGMTCLSYDRVTGRYNDHNL